MTPKEAHAKEIAERTLKELLNAIDYKLKDIDYALECQPPLLQEALMVAKEQLTEAKKKIENELK
jgi:hypothetical protein